MLQPAGVRYIHLQSYNKLLHFKNQGFKQLVRHYSSVWAQYETTLGKHPLCRRCRAVTQFFSIHMYIYFQSVSDFSIAAVPMNLSCIDFFLRNA